MRSAGLKNGRGKLWKLTCVGQKTRFLKNKAEKLLKTKVEATWVAINKPENKAEKLLKTRSCGKNKPKTNRKTKLPILLKIKEASKTDRWSF